MCLKLSVKWEERGREGREGDDKSVKGRKEHRKGRKESRGMGKGRLCSVHPCLYLVVSLAFLVISIIILSCVLGEVLANEYR